MMPIHSSDEIDDDGDGFAECVVLLECAAGGGFPGGDCDDADPDTFPGAPEINDGKDNQCPGDYGDGVVDETPLGSGFVTPGDPDLYTWDPQAAAAEHEAARSSQPDFSMDCAGVITSDLFWIDAESPAFDSFFYYLNRATQPNEGSWGPDSLGAPRLGNCL